MAEIRLNVVVKATPDKVYQAISTQEGLTGWWAKQTIAKPEVGFVNTFAFGTVRNEMEVTRLTPHKKVEWKCIHSNEAWIGTNISFELEEKEGRTLLRFTHAGWREAADFFAECNYAWGRFMTSLKSYCETCTGTPS